MDKIQIQFFHDVICSFCYPMSYRMRLLQKEMPEVEIIHRSFGLIQKERDFAAEFGSREQAKNEILIHWEHANQNDDLHRFNVDGMRRETFLFPMSMKPLWACKAAHSIGGEAAYWDVFDALQAALFTKNKNIEADDVIFELIKSTHLDFDVWLNHFHSDKVKAAVQSDFDLVRTYGIQSVPALVINEAAIISGAVPLEQIRQAIDDMAHSKDRK